MGRTQGVNRDGDDHRRGPIGSNAQAARWVNFLDTLMRHFLAGAVVRLARGVVTSPGKRRLVAPTRRPARGTSAFVAARVAAVLLPPVAAPAEVEHGLTVTAAGLPEAVLETGHGA